MEAAIAAGVAGARAAAARKKSSAMPCLPFDGRAGSCQRLSARNEDRALNGITIRGEMELVAQFKFWEPKQFVLPSSEQLRLYAQAADSLQLYIYQANSALLSYQSYGASLREL